MFHWRVTGLLTYEGGYITCEENFWYCIQVIIYRGQDEYVQATIYFLGEPPPSQHRRVVLYMVEGKLNIFWRTPLILIWATTCQINYVVVDISGFWGVIMWSHLCHCNLWQHKTLGFSYFNRSTGFHSNRLGFYMSLVLKFFLETFNLPPPKQLAH